MVLFILVRVVAFVLIRLIVVGFFCLLGFALIYCCLCLYCCLLGCSVGVLLAL